jgi:hypothetical protein
MAKSPHHHPHREYAINRNVNNAHGVRLPTHIPTKLEGDLFERDSVVTVYYLLLPCGRSISSFLSNTCIISLGGLAQKCGQQVAGVIKYVVAYAMLSNVIIDGNTSAEL